MPLSIDNLLVSIGVAYDLQLKAADNLFYAAAVQVDDPSKPMFGSSAGTAAGSAAALLTTAAGSTADGYFSINNGVEGDPIAIKQISTPNGPLYKVVDGSGNEIMCEANSVTGGLYRGTPRYQVKSDGMIYDLLNTSAGYYVMPTAALPPGSLLYDLPVGRITFKAKEGASLTRATDEQQRAGQVVQLLTRLLEGLQEESKSFAQIIR
ncbi:MAG: hypothetical protein H7338_24030 [Candidatus Sericytochromatia bacterium]|nr:hypothetical protein [Candidatus Sericytochromatia bacterium]